MGLRITQFKTILGKNLLLKKKNKLATLKEVLFPLYTFFVLLLLKMSIDTLSSLEREQALQMDRSRLELESLESISNRETWCQLHSKPCFLPYSPATEETTRIVNAVIAEQVGNNVWLSAQPCESNNALNDFVVSHPGQVFAGVEFSMVGCDSSSSTSTPAPAAGGSEGGSSSSSSGSTPSSDDGGATSSDSASASSSSGGGDRRRQQQDESNNNNNNNNNGRSEGSEEVCIVNANVRLNSSRLLLAKVYGWNEEMYLSAGFLSLQYALSDAIAKVFTGESLPFEIFTQQIPASSQQFDGGAGLLGAVYFVLAFIPTAQIIIVNIVTEKAEKTTECLRMFGLKESVMWAALFSSEFLFTGLVTVLAVLLGNITNLFGDSDMTLVIVIFLAFVASLITYSFMISAMFQQPKVAGAIGGSSLSVQIALFVALSLTNKNALSAATIFSPVAMAIAGGSLWRGDAKWSTLMTGPLPLGLCLSMMIFDTFLYVSAAWYLSLVVPADIGQARPLCFCFRPLTRLLTGQKAGMGDDIPLLNQQSHEDVEGETKRSEDPAAGFVDYDGWEPVADGSSLGVCIRGLTLFYSGKSSVRLLTSQRMNAAGSSGAAVDSVNLDLFQSQIFCLLGKNGAGKTSLISMLTGLVTPTAGCASVNGFDVSEEMHLIRESLGCCPQTEALCAWPSMTPREHLRVYAGIKGIAAGSIESSVSSILSAVGLSDDADRPVSELSGGTKRKLSVAIAVIGKPKFIVLDEPTSGMDPNSRRQVWELLRQLKKESTILMTTHNIVEADAISDRIGIMADGRMRCVGSSVYLKSKFGIGYTLNCHLKKDHQPAANEAAVSAFVTRVVPSAKISDRSPSVISYHMAPEATAQFAALFAELDQSLDELGLERYSLGSTTLEHAFLRISGQPDTMSSPPPPQEQPMREDWTDKWRAAISAKPSRVIRQVSTLLYRRWLSAKRDRRILLNSIIFPTLMMVLALLFSRSRWTPQAGAFLQVTAKTAIGPDAYSSLGVPFTIIEIPDAKASSWLETDLNGVLPTRVVTSKDALDEAVKKGDLGPGGIQFLPDVATKTMLSVFFNNSVPHSTSSILSVTVNALLASRSRVSSTGEPIPSSNKVQIQFHDTALPSASMVGDVMPLVYAAGLLYILPFLAADVVHERVNGLKFVLRSKGASAFAYWFSTMFADTTLCMITAVLALIIGAISASPLFLHEPFLGSICLFLSFVVSVVPYSHVLSFLFSTVRSVHKYMALLLIGSAVVPISVATMLLTVYPASIFLVKLALVAFPPASFCEGMLALSSAVVYGPTMTHADVIDLVRWPCLRLLLALAIYFPLCLFLDSWWGQENPSPEETARWQTAANNGQEREGGGAAAEGGAGQVLGGGEDSDVRDESARVMGGDAENDLLVAKQLYRVYAESQHKELVALRDLTLGVPFGECFVLLGPNGAGKTTTMSILSGHLQPTAGDATVAGVSVRTSMPTIFRALGASTQQDTLWEYLTPREHLQIISSLLARSPEEINECVEEVLAEVDLSEHADKVAKKLSGGSKRKLNVALALINKPLLLLLDEPTTGMDPVSKRLVWNSLASQTSNGSVVLSTHCMDEADALASRIGIFVNGRLRCLGSPSHLKAKFGDKLTVHCTTHEPETIEAEFRRELGEETEISTEQSIAAETIAISLPAAISLAALFRILEDCRSRQFIRDYVVSQSSLEQVYLRVTEEQN